MSIFSKLFGFKWSLYFCKPDRILHYMMHCNNPYDMLGLIDIYFKETDLRPGWRLYLNHNATNDFIELKKDGYSLSEIGDWIYSLAPNFPRGRYEDPIVVDLTGNKERNIPLYSIYRNYSIDEYIKHREAIKNEITFSDIMKNQVFEEFDPDAELKRKLKESGLDA